MTTLGCDFAKIPSILNPWPYEGRGGGITSLNPINKETGENMLGHACSGALVRQCSQMFVFRPQDLEKRGLTQQQALERQVCRICKPTDVDLITLQAKRR